ncbi:MAG TPA: tyrosine-type recombinase/integrase [Blastocatellia bacterium]|nr:tyrosine-type recombinase/integrase [Blastocatellia bacterium]
MSRRTGQIIKRGDGRYMVRIFTGRDSVTGKRQYHNKTVRGSKKDAQTYLTAALRRLDLGELIEPSEKLLADYLTEWLETAAKPRVSERSLETYSYVINEYVIPDLGKKKIATLKAIDLQKFYGRLRDRGLSSKTIHYIHTLLKDALRQAVRWQMIRQNPGDLIDAPRIEQREMQAMSSDEGRQFLQAANEDSYGLALIVALTTGARPGEYTALRWSDVHWQAGKVTIQRGIVWRRKKLDGVRWYFKEVKTTQSRRSIPLPPAVMKSLADHRRRQAEERLKAGSLWKNYDLIFTKDDGNPLDPKSMRDHFKATLKRAGLSETIRLYDLRHSCATILFAEGENPKVVSERLGHASIKQTLSTYTHVLPGMQEKATERLESALFK